MRDVAPGEAIYVSIDGQLYTRQCAAEPGYAPCIFEFVRFAVQIRLSIKCLFMPVA